MNGQTGNTARLDILTNTATIGSGPRIVNSTMGAVQSLTVDGVTYVTYWLLTPS